MKVTVTHVLISRISRGGVEDPEIIGQTNHQIKQIEFVSLTKIKWF